MLSSPTVAVFTSFHRNCINITIILLHIQSFNVKGFWFKLCFEKGSAPQIQSHTCLKVEIMIRFLACQCAQITRFHVTCLHSAQMDLNKSFSSSKVYTKLLHFDKHTLLLQTVYFYEKLLIINYDKLRVIVLSVC